MKRMYACSILVIASVCAVPCTHASPQSDSYIEIYDANGKLVRKIELPFSQDALWKEAARRKLEKEYWGTNRFDVRLSSGDAPVLCRTISSQPLANWLAEFKAQTTDPRWKQLEPQYEAFVSALLEKMPAAHVTFGQCGTASNNPPTAVVALDSEKPDEFLWLDAAGSSRARMCRRMGSDLGKGLRITCNFVGGDLKANDDGSTFFKSAAPAKVDQTVLVKVDSDEFVDLCVVGSAGKTGPLPQKLVSGELMEPGGKRIEQAELGTIMCARSSQNGRLLDQSVTYPSTWIGVKSTRGWVDFDADGRADLCRVVSPVNAYSTNILLLCTQLLEGGFGQSFVELVDLK